MKKFLAPFALLLCGLLFQSGCTGAGSVIVTGLRIELTGLERAGDGTVTVSWRIMNPNVAPYLMTRVRHKIYLNGTLVGKTMDNDPMGVPAQLSTSKTSKLSVADQAAERILREALTAGSASYRVESLITVRLYGETIDRSSLTNSGTVPVTGK